MAESNVEAVRRGFEAALRGDLDFVAELLAADVKWHGGDPGAPGACRNRGEALAVIREAELGRGGGLRLVDVVDAGDKVVVILQPAGGDAPVANLVTFRDGKVVEMVHYPNAQLVREAGRDDAPVIGRLLHDFNVEFDEVTPGPAKLAERMRELLAAGDTVVLVGGAGPDGLAVLRFRPSIWTSGLECYLAELYVAPARRGAGLGRALLEAVLETARARGADYIDLNTSEADVAARHLYESMGFVNREGGPRGPVAYYYERDL